MEPLNCKVIVGSTRPKRTSEKILPWVMEALSARPEFAPEVLDLRDYPMPFYDEPASPSGVTDGQYPNETVRAWAKKIGEADCFVMIVPEYNHGPSGVLKNALDAVYAEWNKKPVAFVSYGGVGGARAIEQLRQVAVELQMASVRSAAHIMSPWNLMDESGEFSPGALDAYASGLSNALDQLAWWGRALKAGRTAAA